MLLLLLLVVLLRVLLLLLLLLALSLLHADLIRTAAAETGKRYVHGGCLKTCKQQSNSKP